METDRLRYFCVIVNTGSLTKAAELLGVSHSGLSKAMSVLQDELGFKVLMPKGRGLELTEDGKNLYEQSRKIIEMVNALKGRQVPLAYATLRIGLPEVLALAVSEHIAAEFTKGITIEDLDSGEMEARVLDRRADFAYTFVPFPHKELEHLKISTVTLSSFARAGVFKNQEVETIPYVIPASELKDNPLSIKIRDGWNSNLPRLTLYRASSLSIAMKMVQSGTCAIYTPDFLVAKLNATEFKSQPLAALDLTPHRLSKEQTRRDIFLVKRSKDDESKAMKLISKIVRQVTRNC